MEFAYTKIKHCFSFNERIKTSYLLNDHGTLSLVAPSPASISYICALLSDVSCLRFCSDTFGNDPPLNTPKFVAGAKFDFDFGFGTPWNNENGNIG